ncbi:RNA-directed DNA polymerase [Apibacter muscae]|nr:RNA-directed DNA polymerase [Apibacter muscae]
MKRIGKLYPKIYNMENLILADEKAQKGKSKQYGVQIHNKNKDTNLLKLHEMLKDKTYSTSKYDIFKVYEPKEREVYRLPYFPDRITHHAIMNVLEPLFVASFTADTYSCIKHRGIHACVKKLKQALTNKEETIYCLKLDITKFYPSINHGVLKNLLRRKFKDTNLLWLLDEIINSAPGLPIGNYLSQYLANFYLTYFDHWLKEEKKVKYYFRYADDLVILSDNKLYLHSLLHDIKQYLNTHLKLLVKSNYQIFPVQARGIDFLGYRFYHTHILLRKRIKKNFARMLKQNRNPASIASYKGWTIHCNSKNLLKKLLKDEPV